MKLFQILSLLMLAVAAMPIDQSSDAQGGAQDGGIADDFAGLIIDDPDESDQPGGLDGAVQQQGAPDDGQDGPSTPTDQPISRHYGFGRRHNLRIEVPDPDDDDDGLSQGSVGRYRTPLKNARATKLTAEQRKDMEDTDCAICLKGMAENLDESAVKLLNCPHCYCHGCIREAVVKGHEHCPQCRQDMINTPEDERPNTYQQSPMPTAEEVAQLTGSPIQVSPPGQQRNSPQDYERLQSSRRIARNARRNLGSRFAAVAGQPMSEFQAQLAAQHAAGVPIRDMVVNVGANQAGQPDQQASRPGRLVQQWALEQDASGVAPRDARINIGSEQIRQARYGNSDDGDQRDAGTGEGDEI